MSVDPASYRAAGTAVAASAKRKNEFSSTSQGFLRWSAPRRYYYFAMRPERLRIAVGPANSNDIKVVQRCTPALLRKRTPDPPASDSNRRRGASAERLARAGRSRDQCAADLEVPKNAQAVATLRKNVAVCGCRPASKFKGQESQPINTKFPARRHPYGGVDRTQANVNVLGDPGAIGVRSEQGRKKKIVQFPADTPRTPAASEA